jgi:murein DD-endopeptidase MepM/ murein hydrolase activator NlpD
MNLDQAKQDAASVKSSFERLARAYADQNTKLNLTQETIIQTRREITHGLEQKASLESQLQKRAHAAYQGSGVGFFQVLLNARSFQDFSVRYMALQRQSLSDEGVILQLRKKRTELQTKERELSAQHALEQGETASLRDQGRELTISFVQAQELATNLEGKLKPDEIAQLFRMGGTPGDGVRIALYACPVNGPHFVSNDFGAPRDGGTRKHQGNDIIAPMGTTIVAPLSGTITLLQSSGKGGLAIFETGVGNVGFYFAHEQEITAHQGDEVTAGQEIGRVGNTGNAAGGTPHLHFEIHPARGAAIDPYPSLSAVC